MLTHTSPDMTKVPGGWMPEGKIDLSGSYIFNTIFRPEVKQLTPHIHLVEKLVSSMTLDVEQINRFMTNAPHFAPVSIQGMQDTTPDTTGSFRATMWNPQLAKEIEKLLQGLFNRCQLPNHKVCDELTSTDWWQGGELARNEWMYYGVSPMLRYMKYPKGGQHFAHYDAGFIYPDDNYRTLKSFVLYLSTNKTGATRIIEDEQQDIPVWNRNHADWGRPVQDMEVLFKSPPVAGSMLVFDHRICHDVEPYDGAEGDRIIIRGDLIYQAL